MKPVARYLFPVMVVLFGAWILYLGYLVVLLPTWPNGLPLVLSRPQFLVSQLDIIGAIDDADAELTILDLLHGQGGAGDRAEAASATDLIVAPVEGPFSAAPILSRYTIKAHKVTVQQVLYPPDDRLQPGQVIAVTNFGRCNIPGTPPVKLSALGPCLLPLRTRDGGETWEVVPLPPSPGFENASDYRIYPADKETLAQYHQIAKPGP